MTKVYLSEIANYSHWADNAIITWLEQINDEQRQQEIASSFNYIGKTVIHLVSAKKIWIDFWQNVPYPVFLSTEFKGTKPN